MSIDRVRNRTRLRFALPAVLLLLVAGTAAAQQPTTYRIMEDYPDRILAARESYRKQLEQAGSPAAGVPFYLLVPRIQRWQPGRAVRVAFNGGTTQLHEAIRSAAASWTQQKGANLQFVFHDSQGRFLRWTAQDTQFAAEIRIGFLKGKDFGGFWSAVGTDSVTAAAGGVPNAPSMNLEGFDDTLPLDWQAVVMHEFGHALGFEHEHQSPAGGCDFRFDDDPGYEPRKDAYGWYTTDSQGRKPGMYTYLGGHANYWPRDRVDRNLRVLPTSSAFLIGAFDRTSVMKYLFPAFMLSAGDKSLCYTATENAVLSAQDLEGARRAYPRGAAAIATINGDAVQALEQIRADPEVPRPVREEAAMRLKAEHNR